MSATLNGNACSGARVQVSDWGAWWVDATLTTATEIAKGAAATIQFADLALSGTVVNGGAIDGRAVYRIVGGRGGWIKTIPRKAYMNDAGVKASIVVSDAATAAGETVDGAPTARLGSHFARAEDLASNVLNTIAPRAWRVDFDGVTRFGKRPTTPYTGDAARTLRDLGAGVYELATETLAGLLPGVTIDGSEPATDVEYALDANKIRVTIWTGARTRGLNAIERIVLALFPNLRYAGAFEFRVVGQEGERLHLQPVRSATGLPDLARVPVRPGMAGLKAKHLEGSLVVVQFLDAAISGTSRPIVTGFDEADAPGWMPLELDLGEVPQLGVARQTDPVIAGGFGGVITRASARIKAGL